MLVNSDMKFEASTFDVFYRNLKIDPENFSPKVGLGLNLNDVEIDLSEFNFLSLFDLLNLFLLIDSAQASHGRVTVHFNKLLSGNSDQLLDVNSYNALRNADKAKISESERRDYYNSKGIYNVISFANSFGLLSALSRQRSAGRVFFAGLSQRKLESLKEYSGINRFGSRVLPLISIDNVDVIENFRFDRHIKSWLSALPQDIISSPIFSDGEFSRVLGYQLGLNIIQHSGDLWRGPFGSYGAIGMRVIKTTNDKVIDDSFPKSWRKIFDATNMRGVLEICVGDRGYGIGHTLSPALKAMKSKYGLKNDVTSRECLGFAFDEIGSCKPTSSMIGGVHALYRILNCVIKYNGILRVRSNGVEFVFDATEDNCFKRGDNNLGIFPDESRQVRVLHPFGTQFQILVPLTKFQRKNVEISRRGKAKNSDHLSLSSGKIRIVQVDPYVNSFSKNGRNDKSFLGELVSQLSSELEDKVIVYSIEDSSRLSEESFVEFIRSQKAILHSKCCFFVGVDKVLAKILSERDGLGWGANDDRYKDHRLLFDVLSAKHKLLIVVDNEENVYWYGIGRYYWLSEVFSRLLQGGSQPSGGFDDIYTMLRDWPSEFPSESSLVEVLCLYLSNNEQYFCKTKHAKDYVWRSKVTIQFLRDLKQKVASFIFCNKLDSLSVLKTGDGHYYKLPSRKEYTTAFLHSTPLLQDQIVAEQIGDWFGCAIRELVGEEVTKLALVCVTAPSELLSRTIASSLLDLNITIINLGYYSRLDSQFFNDSKQFSLPIVLVADIIDEGKTLNELLGFMLKNKYDVIGIVSLFNIVSNLAPCKFEVVMSLGEYVVDSNPSKTIDHFVFSRMGRPSSVQQEEICGTVEDSNLFSVDLFSLEPFKYSSLSSVGNNTDSEILNRNRIVAIEKANALRYGHWVMGGHHFKVTFSMPCILESDAVAGSICDEICSLCLENEIDYILTPLHSSIGSLLPRILSSLKIVYGREVEHVHCLANKVLSKQYFYLLPENIKSSIVDRCKDLNEGKVAVGLRFLIIDDAVVSGRTVETLIRSFMHVVEQNCVYYSLKKSPVESIVFYAILDRQEFAKNKFLTVSHTLFPPTLLPSAHDFSVKFKYKFWVELDVSDNNSATCRFCNERKIISNIIYSGRIPSAHSASSYLKEKKKKMAPQSQYSSNFFNYSANFTPRTFEIGRFVNNNCSASTCELVLLEFYNLVNRGYPFDSLIEKYLMPIFYFKNEERDGKFEDLKCEMLEELFQNWIRIYSQWCGVAFRNLILDELKGGTTTSIVILKNLGKIMAESQTDNEKKFLSNIFRKAIALMLVISRSKSESKDKLYNLSLGCSLFFVYYSQFNDANNIPQAQLLNVLRVLKKNNSNYAAKMYFQDIIQVARSCEFSREAFLPSLITVLDHTVRYYRHSHSHLIPSFLSRIVSRDTISGSEISIMKNAMIEFCHCLEIVDQRYPSLFQDEAAHLLKRFLGKMKQLCANLKSDANAFQLTDAVDALVQDVLGIYPAQRYCKIFLSLIRTQISVARVIDYFSDLFNNAGLCVSFEPLDRDLIENTFIIAPSFRFVVDIIYNFTFDPVKGRVSSENKIHFKICIPPLDRTYSKVVLEIYTNFTDSKSAKDRLANGQGVCETQCREFVLFDIQCPLDFDIEPSLGGYTTMFQFCFARGFKHSLCEVSHA